MYPSPIWIESQEVAEDEDEDLQCEICKPQVYSGKAVDVVGHKGTRAEHA